MVSSNKSFAEEAPLSERLRERIRRKGPITFRDWMEAALYDAREGYYCRSDRERWGREGDYRTSPERSPLFAATFARYFAELYDHLGLPASLLIFEAGAGAGHFAAGVLETLERRCPKIFAGTRYVIDETSESSRASAQIRLARFADRVCFTRLGEIETTDPAIIFANELLDAFPVHRVTLRDGQLQELYVGLDETGAFVWIAGHPSTARLVQYLKQEHVQLAEDQIVEINLGIEDWLAQVSKKLRNGYIVTVDYGAEASELHGSPERRQGTLRAFQRHRLAEDILAHPGERDLTATIDWSFAKRIGARLGLETVEFAPLDQFLLNHGLLAEIELMAEEIPNEAEQMQLRTSAREMILPSGMAASYQVLVQRKDNVRNPRSV